MSGPPRASAWKPSEMMARPGPGGGQEAEEAEQPITGVSNGAGSTGSWAAGVWHTGVWHTT